VDDYGEASVTARREVGARLHGRAIAPNAEDAPVPRAVFDPDSDDIEQAYSETATLAKHSPAIKRVLETHARGEETAHLTQQHEGAARGADVVDHTMAMPGAPPRVEGWSEVLRTMPLGRAVQGFAVPLHATGDSGGPPPPPSGPQLGSTAPPAGAMNAMGIPAARTALVPSPGPLNPPVQPSAARTTVATRSQGQDEPSPDASAWLGVLTFFLVLGSLGILAWLTFPMWRAWANL
jgi:hypothetical protein